MADDATKEKAQDGASALKTKTISLGVGIAIAVVALVIGVLVGHFAMGAGGIGGASSAGGFEKGSIGEAQLDTVMATYTYAGGTKSITARQVLEQSGSLEMSKNEDGSYFLPSADAVLSVARKQIINEEIDKRGITVSDEELKKYAKDSLGMDDYASFASEYGMTADQLKGVLNDELKLQKLREELSTGITVVEIPEEPTMPEFSTTDAEGKELDEAAVTAAEEEAYNRETKEYADYIIKLAGDEWDAESGTWKSPDGPYAAALADYKITNDAASYNAASMAYTVAYQDYAEQQSKVDESWTTFSNELLGNANITINTMAE